MATAEIFKQAMVQEVYYPRGRFNHDHGKKRKHGDHKQNRGIDVVGDQVGIKNGCCQIRQHEQGQATRQKDRRIS